MFCKSPWLTKISSWYFSLYLYNISDSLSLSNTLHLSIYLSIYLSLALPHSLFFSPFLPTWLACCLWQVCPCAVRPTGGQGRVQPCVRGVRLRSGGHGHARHPHPQEAHGPAHQWVGLGHLHTTDIRGLWRWQQRHVGQKRVSFIPGEYWRVHDAWHLQRSVGLHWLRLFRCVLVSSGAFIYAFKCTGTDLWSGLR